ncbi:hypothetical protein HK097_004513, partial [Rhizophlyctis rosea]
MESNTSIQSDTYPPADPAYLANATNTTSISFLTRLLNITDDPSTDTAIMNSDATSITDPTSSNTTTSLNVTIPSTNGKRKNATRVTIEIDGSRTGTGGSTAARTISSGSLTNLSNETIMYGALNAAIFGALVVWALFVIHQSFKTYRSRKKPLYLLNLLQSFFHLIKTLAATLYA